MEDKTTNKKINELYELFKDDSLVELKDGNLFFPNFESRYVMCFIDSEERIIIRRQSSKDDSYLDFFNTAQEAKEYLSSIMDLIIEENNRLLKLKNAITPHIKKYQEQTKNDVSPDFLFWKQDHFIKLSVKISSTEKHLWAYINQNLDYFKVEGFTKDDLGVILPNLLELIKNVCNDTDIKTACSQK